MNDLPANIPSNTTSAAGSMVVRQVNPVLVVGCLLAGVGTSAAYTPPIDGVRLMRPVDQTTNGATVIIPESAGASIGELRRLSGFTWDQLARIFNVSRRSLHFWASGKPMARGNEEHLQRLLSVVRKIDCGSANANRALLLGACEDGSLPFDLLAVGDYERVLSILAPGGAHRASPPKLSEEALEARLPRPPEELVAALNDRIHLTSGRLRASKAITASLRK